MKQLNKFFILFLSIALISACTKSLDSRIIGKWDSSEKAIYIINSIFVSDTLNQDEYGEMSFRDGGSGTFKLGVEKTQFEWSIEKNQVMIRLDSAESRTFDVHVNDDNDQIWYYYKADSTVSENEVFSKEEWISILSLTKIKESVLE